MGAQSGGDPMSNDAAGSIRVEAQDALGSVIGGLTLEDSTEIFGDDLEHVVPWKGGRTVGEVSGQPIRIRIAMKDADLYSFRFR